MNVARSLRETIISEPNGCQKTIHQGRVYNLDDYDIFPDHINLVFVRDERQWTGRPLDWEIYALNIVG